MLSVKARAFCKFGCGFCAFFGVTAQVPWGKKTQDQASFDARMCSLPLI